ncbi:MAG: hypothetical protein IJU44_00850 [Kiritimatiellae bacterium]|nr:hypothetical protein [Kiritimatiellia bacterium]
MSEKMLPKPVILDEVKPSPEQLREAYELALQLWELAPWDMPMGENQLLAVERADGRTFALSVMGEYGEHRAVGIYPRVSSYCQIANVPPFDDLRLRDAFFSIRQTQFAFLKAADLLKGERAAIKASGVKFPRGVNPSLVSYVPGYAPEMMGAGELAEAIDAIKVLLDFFKTHSAEEINLFDTEDDLVSVWRESPDRTWTLGEKGFPLWTPVAVSLSQPLLDQVAVLSVNKDFNLEIGAIPVPCGNSDSGRGFMGRFMVAVDGETQFALGTDLIPPPDGREFDWTPAVEFVLRTMVKFGCKPGKLGVIGNCLETVLCDLSYTTLKGTKLLSYCECNAVRDVFEFVAQ